MISANNKDNFLLDVTESERMKKALRISNNYEKRKRTNQFRLINKRGKASMNNKVHSHSHPIEDVNPECQ
uniref:Putative ovule protein n=1 Tax=Solanum chacoense TaxID=4108 RepID=A0A0V0GLG5_SOLCH